MRRHWEEKRGRGKGWEQEKKEDSGAEQDRRPSKKNGAQEGRGEAEVLPRAPSGVTQAGPLRPGGPRHRLTGQEAGGSGTVPIKDVWARVDSVPIKDVWVELTMGCPGSGKVVGS